METLKIKLFRKALIKHRAIIPCGDKKRFADCFTVEKGILYFWYNDTEGSTHLMKEVLS